MLLGQMVKSLPTNQAYGLDYPIIQYADDTLLIMPADEEQLSHLKYLLNLFSMSTGLFVNYSKSSMIPINMDQQSINNLANSFGCRVESLPFTYLGLPMGTTKPSVHDLIPVISKIDKRLSGVARFMNHSGRLTYVNSVVASMPIFAMCSLKVHVTILDHVDKSSRNFLWYGNEINKGGKCLASWEMICKPKQQGGLGVLNLREQNKALLIKHLFKFYNKVDVPWVKLIWEAHYHNNDVPHYNRSKGSFWCKMYDLFREMTTCDIKSGCTNLLWDDIWNGDIRKIKYPELHSFTQKESISIKEAKELENIYNLFQLPLSIQAHQQFHLLSGELNNIRNSDDKDTWTFNWGNNKNITKKIYGYLMNGEDAADTFKWIWKSCCLPRHKFFCWLMLNDRINTCDLLTRKSMHLDSTVCVLCNNEDYEDMTHLLFTCPFSQGFWWNIGFEWNSDMEINNMIIDAKHRYKIDHFMEIMILGCWSIWNQRNGMIFEGIPCSINDCKIDFVRYFKMTMLRAKPTLKEGMSSWIDNI